MSEIKRDLSGSGKYPLSGPLFISDTSLQEEAAKREFSAEGLILNFISGSRYLEEYLSAWDQLEVWVKPQVEAWDHGVRVLGKIDRRHP